VHFGARVLILGEPTAAPGVKQSGVMLECTAAAGDARDVIIINHRPQRVGNHRFVILTPGRRVLDERSEVTLEELTGEMTGDRELEELAQVLER